uniref:Uncharacterized protein n=1 Tax=Ananas comosus var. bracteatus TaxID=296719 RepID=A0A6V7NFZ9_ANACO|nr:unnamed protein product [Ananas comosus var. bracteatus]
MSKAPIHLLRSQGKRISCPPIIRDQEWELVEMNKKNPFVLRVWGLIRALKLLCGLFVALFVILVVSLVTTTSSNSSSSNNNNNTEESTWHVEESSCDYFVGKWVYDNNNNSTYPLYEEKGCKFMSDQLACEKFGRRDLRFQQWRWQPHGCDIPRFNATKLLEKLRGKRLAFVGDSLNRNQWVSMVCLIDTSTPQSLKTMESNGSLMSFKIMDYNASIDFYWSPLLVESNSDDPVHHRVPDRTVRAQSIQKHARHWTDADVLVFNSYLWWQRPKMKVLWGSFDDDDGIYKEIESLRGYEMALKTWSDWLEFHIDRSRTRLFFMSMSPTHFWGDEWGMDSDQNCYNETEPIFEQGYRGRGSDSNMMNVVEKMIEGLKERGVRVQVMNITQLSEYRKDGHPSIFRKQWEPLTEEQIKNPSSYADCIHWCLPGVPDVWNKLLYAYISS